MSFKSINPSLIPPDVAKLPRTAKRLTQLLLKGSQNLAPEAQKEWSLDFLLSPISFEASSNALNVLSSISFAKTNLQGPDIYNPRAKVLPSTETTSIKTSLAFKSIGYKSVAIEGMKDLGIDFDSIRGIIPNDSCGRVTSLSADGTGIPGLYCSGWVKRGPTGVIANTMEDSFATAEAIIKDWEDGQPFMTSRDGWNALRDEAIQRGLRPVSWGDWKKIDNVEKQRGVQRGKEREKLGSVQEMLSVLD